MKRSGFKRYDYATALKRLQAKRKGKKPEPRFGLSQKPIQRNGKPLRAKPDRKLQAWSRKVRERDGNQCRWPGGCKTGDTRIDAHHIAERSLRPDLRLDTSNGIALCRSHHARLEGERSLGIELGLITTESYELAQRKNVHLSAA